MLSILIPTYNYNTYPLVQILHEQAVKLKILFEVIVLDDCSTETINENDLIGHLSNTTYIKLPENIGRSAIRNKLASLSKYSCLLFLDADVIPANDDFLKTYIATLQNHDVAFGGISYKSSTTQKPSLRLKYGIEREAIPLNFRLKSPYTSFTTANFLIKKDTFNKFGFKELYKSYGYEDTLFAFEMKKKNVKIDHIDNPVLHLGVEPNEVFLKKSLESVNSLHYLIENDILDKKNTSISKAFNLVSKLKLTALFSCIYKKQKHRFEKQLLSAKPNLIIFDLYRLCHLCNLEKK